LSNIIIYNHMKQNRLKLLASGLILASLAGAVLSAPLLTVRAADNNLLDSQMGLNKIGEKYGASSFDDTNNSLTIIIIRVINISLDLLGLLVLVLMIVSGYQWMTAAGNEDQIATAKKRITNAAIGLLIILAAWSITQFVFYRVVMPATTGLYYAPLF